MSLSKSTYIYDSDRKTSIISSFIDLYNYRELIILWTKREIKGRYRQSIIGIGWAIIPPVFTMIVFSVIFGNFAKIGSEGIPYPVFSYVAILPWTYFANVLSSGNSSLLANMQLIRRIYFPREILIFSSVLSRALDFLISLIILICLLIYYDIPINYFVLLFPVLLFIQILLATSIVLFTSTISIFVRDISFAMSLIIQLWMYITPVIYSIDEIPEKWKWIYMLNPMANIIDGYRKITLHGTSPDLGSLAATFSISLLVFYLSYKFFKRYEKVVPDIA